MPESPAETLRHAAAARRLWADGPFIRQRDRPTVEAVAGLLDSVAAEMDAYSRVEERDSVVGVVEFLGGSFRPSETWTAALAAARAYLGEEATS